MKGEEFLKVHKLFHGLTPGFLMENFDIETMAFPDSIVSMIPEEFTDLKKFAGNFVRNYTDLLAKAIGYAHLWKQYGFRAGCSIPQNSRCVKRLHKGSRRLIKNFPYVGKRSETTKHKLWYN